MCRGRWPRREGEAILLVLVGLHQMKISGLWGEGGREGGRREVGREGGREGERGREGGRERGREREGGGGDD